MKYHIKWKFYATAQQAKEVQQTAKIGIQVFVPEVSIPKAFGSFSRISATSKVSFDVAFSPQKLLIVMHCKLLFFVCLKLLMQVVAVCSNSLFPNLVVPSTVTIYAILFSSPMKARADSPTLRHCCDCVSLCHCGTCLTLRRQADGLLACLLSLRGACHL